MCDIVLHVSIDKYYQLISSGFQGSGVKMLTENIIMTYQLRPHLLWWPLRRVAIVYLETENCLRLIETNDGVPRSDITHSSSLSVSGAGEATLGVERERGGADIGVYFLRTVTNMLFLW